MSGVCVLLGCGDGTLAMKLAEGRSLLVHALETEANKVKAIRAAWLARGWYGQISVEHWPWAQLPYADNLVNVLIAEHPGAVPDSEILRALVPNGFAWIQRDGAWRKLRKPWPKNYDEWTHGRHGADGNMVSQDLAVGVPTGLRWVAGPAQDAAGKKWYYDHVLVSARGRNFYFYEDRLTARDAFNGSLLWTRPVKASTFRETGTEVPDFLKTIAKLGVRLTKVKPVAAGDRLFVAAEGKLMALDAASGKTVAEFGAITNPREILFESNVVVVAENSRVRAFDANALTVLWETAMGTKRIVAGAGSVFCLASNAVVSLELATGKERWRTEDSKVEPAATCTYHQGIVVLEKSSWRDDPEGCGILVYSGMNGRLLWQMNYRPDQTHYQEARSFYAQNLLWLQMQTNRVAGFDPLTGQLKQSWLSRGLHCATPVATERYFIAPECDFTDLKSGALTRARMFKNACRLPFIPANGLLYSFPVQCECFPMLRGYMGLSAATTPAQPARVPKHEKGPAFGRPGTRLAVRDAGNEWPMYRHDKFRSGSTSAVLPGTELKQLWSVAVAQAPKTGRATDWSDNPFVRGVITPPVAAGLTLVVAVPDEHRVVALDGRSGQPRWSYTAGGRIDTPPTLHEDLCLFGSHDGWVYGVSAADGELAWRFRAAPQDTRIMAYGQMESPWPVPGSVLIDNGVAYLAAGRHPLSDGGVRVLALKARTGQVVWEKTVHELALKSWYDLHLPNRNKIGLDFEPVDLLVRDGDCMAMSRWRFNPRNGDFKLMLASTEYEAADVKVPRGFWGYGIRQSKSVANKPPAVFDQRQVYAGTTNDVALLLAGDTLVTASSNGALKVGAQSWQLTAPAVHDGLAAANGRLYVATQDGRVSCFE